MIVTTSTITVYWLARLVAKESGAPVRLWEWLLLGICLGLAALSKLQGLGLWVLAALAVVGMAWRRRNPKLLWQALLPVALPALALAGWWYARNYVLYGDFTGLGDIIAINGQRTKPLTLSGWWREFRGMRYSFWGLFGWFNILLPVWVYTLLDWVGAVALGGLLFDLLRLRGRTSPTWPNERGRHVKLLLAGWVAILFMLFLYWMSRATGTQGRLFFPALSAVVILLIAGLAVWLRIVPHSWQTAIRPIVWGGLPALLLGCSLYTGAVLLPAAYRAPRPVTHIPPTAKTVDITYGEREQLVLLALETPAGRFHPGDEVPITLYMTAPAKLQGDYQLFIQLLDERGQPIANLTTHPGWGRNPTSLWQPGAIYADRYPVRIDRAIDPRAPLLARVYTGFIDPATEKSGRLPVVAHNRAGDEIQPFLGTVAVAPAAPPN